MTADPLRAPSRKSQKKIGPGTPGACLSGRWDPLARVCVALSGGGWRGNRAAGAPEPARARSGAPEGVSRPPRGPERAQRGR